MVNKFDKEIVSLLHKASNSAYDPASFEKVVYNFWESNDYFEPTGSGEPFTIIMPPPNLTGELHLGHALTVAIEDSLIRWNRMMGKKTLWLPGVDHAAIAVNAIVEKKLNADGIDRKALGREKFLKKIWEFVGDSRERIAAQHRRLGASADWKREKFTMDEGPALAVRKTFVDLYNDGLIYRGERIVNWDTSSQTVVSDLEVEYLEEEGNFWYVRYSLVDNPNQYITIATTRPETIPADTAIAVHPDDQRYKELIGKRVLVPIVNREVEIIADEVIDQNLGTGALKVTPGHDQLDFEIGERHSLEVLSMINLDGTLNDIAGDYAGIDRLEARQLIVGELENLGIIEKTELIEHSLSISQRTGSVIEPLVSKQWFVNIKPLALNAIKVVENKQIQFVPERFEKTYIHWMKNIRDWTISRQIWWGHRIPVWYCDQCSKEIVAFNDPDSCPDCESSHIFQDEDTLDTWFSSGLWPHSTLGWPNQEDDDLNKFYPTQVMETGYDIIFFWVARMIMLSIYNMDGIPPFKYVYLHGLVRAKDGSKMSKSKNNVVDPIKLVEEFGTDALRFSLLAGSTPGNDQRITEEKIIAGRNFANKLWNAKRFVLSSTSDTDIHSLSQLNIESDVLQLEDKWILSKLNILVDDTHRLMSKFEISEALVLIRDFFWDDFADWYIEIAKIRNQDNQHNSLVTNNVLVYTFSTVIQLLHPFMPFITEVIWHDLIEQKNVKNCDPLIISSYPDTSSMIISDINAEKDFESIKDLIINIRNIRSENKVEASKWQETTIISDSSLDLINSMDLIISKMGRCEPLITLNSKGELSLDECATASLPVGLIAIPLKELINPGEEIIKIKLEIEKTNNGIERLNDLLSNTEFINKAPKNVVASNQKKMDDLSEQLNNLHNALQRFTNKK
ncbi:MAG: valine--tRNA ligase [Dehalococcoidia bacterium]|nr:valine--tRNA ligase [Dehalococcoidia bacterium]